MSDFIEVTDHDHESRVHQIKRHPIFLSDNTVMLLTMFRAHNHISDLWLLDFCDHYNNQKRAARQLIEQIGDSASINYWQELRAAIAEEIDRINAKRGTVFKHDKPSHTTEAKP